MVNQLTKHSDAKLNIVKLLTSKSLISDDNYD